MSTDGPQPSKGAPQPRSFLDYTAALADRARATPGVLGVVLLGSASDVGASRRDEWSDHDFYVLLEAGREDDLRGQVSFLPMPERIVLLAREGFDGFSVLYDDGHMFELGAGTVEQFGSAKFGQHQLLLGDDHVARWTEQAVARGRDFTPVGAEDAVGLALVKLLIGFGRARRGEVLSGSAFVRGHAVAYLTLATRQRISPASPSADTFDPLRRFEIDYPDISHRINTALQLPIMDAARQLLIILRSQLEPGWPEFPTAAADIVAQRIS